MNAAGAVVLAVIAVTVVWAAVIEPWRKRPRCPHCGARRAAGKGDCRCCGR